MAAWGCSRSMKVSRQLAEHARPNTRGSSLTLSLLLACCRQAAAQDASASQPKQDQGQEAAAAEVAEGKDAGNSVELRRQRAKKQGRSQQQKQQGPHPLLADRLVEAGAQPGQQQGVQLGPGEKEIEKNPQPEQQGPHPLLAEEVVEEGKKLGQQEGPQLSQGGTLTGEGQMAQQQRQQQQRKQPDEQQPQTLPQGILPQQQQGPHVLLDERLTEAEEAAAAERMQGIAAGARQDASQQQARRTG